MTVDWSLAFLSLGHVVSAMSVDRWRDAVWSLLYI
jgi:hypothetical protein